jgi:N-acetylglucosamine kinase-like BadF-type ATPase
VAYYIGIDGGGTKTTCAVGAESSLLATNTTGPSNITRVSEARAREALHTAIREACAQAKIDPSQVKRACIGVAGAGSKEIVGRIHQIVAELVSGQIKVVGDMQIALEAAFGAGPGVIVIAGTGSIAYGRNAQGRTARAGGWGFAISDEGSAHWIGRTVVSQVVRAIDESMSNERMADEGISDEQRHPQTAAEALPLFQKIKEAWKFQSLDELVRIANSNPDFAGLFPGIVSAADAGDELAQQVHTQAGQELARLAGIVIGRLFSRENRALAAAPLAMIGGVFRHSSRVRQVFCEEIRKIDANVAVNPQIIDPVMGALEMARKGING